MSAENLEGIRNVLALYCHVIDNQEWDRIGDVYAPNGSYAIHGSEPHEGLEAIVEYLSSITKPEVLTSSNHYIELAAEGTSGTGRGRFLVVFPDMSLAAGDYDDAYVKIDAGWRIQRRTSFVRLRASAAQAHTKNV